MAEGVLRFFGIECFRVTPCQPTHLRTKTSQGEIVERRLDGTVTVLKHLPVGKRVKYGTVLKRVK